MRRKFLILPMLILAVSLSACSGNDAADVNTEESSQQPESESAVPQSESVSEEPSASEETSVSEETRENPNSKILIAYFSRVGNTDFPDDVDAVSSASLNLRNGELTGNTELIAQMIQEETGGELFRIETEKTYPVDYNELVDYARSEPDEDSRPALMSHVENMDEYDVVFLGYPNWWYDMPMPVYSFLEEYDFSGKTVIPFCTHGGSRFSRTVETIEEKLPESVILEGFEIYGEDADGAREGVKDWISGLDMD